MLIVKKLRQLIDQKDERIKELIDYFNMHTPEERRLLYMGAAFMNNLIVHHLEENES